MRMKIELKEEDTWKNPSDMAVNQMFNSLAISCNDTVDGI